MRFDGIAFTETESESDNHDGDGSSPLGSYRNHRDSQWQKTTTAERAARRALIRRGHEIVGSIQNPSGHGIDLITRKAGNLFFWEVKGSEIGRFQLSPAQSSGAASFVMGPNGRLARAAGGARGWGGVDPHIARMAQSLIDEIRDSGQPIRGGIIFFPNLNSGNGTSIQFLPW